jgi:hypothetical protein
MNGRSPVSSSPLAGACATALVLRALVLASPLLAAGCTWRAAHHTVPIVGVVVAVMAGACALHPDSHLGLLVVLVLGAEWLATVHDQATPWSVGAGVALTMFHASLAAATVAPPAATWTRAMCRRWLRRPLMLILGSAGTWAIVVAVHHLRVAGSAVLLVASVVALVLAALWARKGTLDTRAP